ncbi:hypothetical protein DFH29DRAFT_871647 [Suillus ampliporus]|nr:hypothetical protein DFH29DRAFT_871647 [Suillus ampliporus]
MAIMLDNPNEAVLPDFMTGEHRPERAWLLTNVKGTWVEKLEQAVRAAEDAQHPANEQEQEAACKEEHKKNKSKFVPVGVAKVLMVLVIRPLHYAVWKLKAGDYCKLYYFTNKGLREAWKNLVSLEPQGMILMSTEDGHLAWVNADETYDPKSAVTKDENLSWEQFNEVTPHIITAMKQKIV